MCRKMLIVFVNIISWLYIFFTVQSIPIILSCYLVHLHGLCGVGHWCAYNYVAIRVVQHTPNSEHSTTQLKIEKKAAWFFFSLLAAERRCLINLFKIFQPFRVKAEPAKWITSKLSVLYSQSEVSCWLFALVEESVERVR